MVDKRQLENVEYYKYLHSMIPHYSRHAREIKSRIAMAKEDFHQHIGLKFKVESSKELHLEHSFVWC
jgi:hypothetical protein